MTRTSQPNASALLSARLHALAKHLVLPQRYAAAWQVLLALGDKRPMLVRDIPADLNCLGRQLTSWRKRTALSVCRAIVWQHRGRWSPTARGRARHLSIPIWSATAITAISTRSSRASLTTVPRIRPRSSEKSSSRSRACSDRSGSRQPTLPDDVQRSARRRELRRAVGAVRTFDTMFILS